MTGDDHTVPSFAAYTADADDPRFTDWLRVASEPTWTDAITHRFTRELANGTLDETVFERYLVQDFAFVTDLVGAFGRAVADAPTMEAKRRLVTFLDTLTAEENDYFERSSEALDVSLAHGREPVRSQVTEGLIDLLGHASSRGGYAETLAVLVPAEWIYAEWATAVDNHRSERLPFYYAEWIDLHSVPEFVAFVGWLRSELDGVGPTLSSRRRARVRRFFDRTVALEVAFFDDAYSGTGDP